MREWVVQNVGTAPVESFDWLSSFVAAYNVWEWTKEGMTVLWIALGMLVAVRWGKRKLFGNSKHAVANLVLQELRGDGVKWDEARKTVSTNKVVVVYEYIGDKKEVGAFGVRVCDEPVDALLSSGQARKIAKAAYTAIERCKSEAKQIATDLVMKKAAQKTHYKA